MDLMKILDEKIDVLLKSQEILFKQSLTEINNKLDALAVHNDLLSKRYKELESKFDMIFLSLNSAMNFVNANKETIVDSIQQMGITEGLDDQGKVTNLVIETKEE